MMLSTQVGKSGLEDQPSRTVGIVGLLVLETYPVTAASLSGISF